jgi:hypothetical protein
VGIQSPVLQEGSKLGTFMSLQKVLSFNYQSSF